MSTKQRDKFIARYKERYKWFEDVVIDHTAMEMLWINEQEDIVVWKDFLKTILWPSYNRRVNNRWWPMKYWEKVFNALYFNYWPKWMYEIESDV